jgi:hypothetical protein
VKKKKLNPNPMNAPFTPPQVAYRKCVAESVVVEPFGPPPAPPQCFFLLELPPPPLSALSMACCNGAGRKGKERKQGSARDVVVDPRAPPLVCLCARNLGGISKRDPKDSSAQVLYFLAYIYIYSQKGYLLCKLKVLKSSAFSDFLSQKKSKKNFAKKN